MEAKIEFYIPFEGFYYSIYDSIINDVIDSEIEEGYIKKSKAENINYKPIFEAMSVHIFDKIIELFNDEFSLFDNNNFIIYEGLHSPKYYNYSTDKLMAVIDYNNYSLIYGKFILNNSFVDYVNEVSKSRDGFASFYEGIKEVSKEPSIFLEYLFQWFVLNEFRDEVINETCEDIHECIYSNLEYN